MAIGRAELRGLGPQGLPSTIRAADLGAAIRFLAKGRGADFAGGFAPQHRQSSECPVMGQTLRPL